jgi:hypothetical protein
MVCLGSFFQHRDSPFAALLADWDFCAGLVRAEADKVRLTC